MAELVRITRWLYESGEYRLRTSPGASGWRVTRDGQELARGTFEQAKEFVAQQYLTESHDHDKMGSSIKGQPERNSIVNSTEETTETDEASEPKTCECLPDYRIEGDQRVWLTCDEEVAPKRRFRPGHDAKLKSALIWTWRYGGNELVIDTARGREVRSAMAIADSMGWARFLTDAPAKPAKTEDVPTEEKVEGFYPARVFAYKVWYDGQVVSRNGEDKTVTVQYANKAGKTKRVTLAEDSERLDLS